MTFGWNAISMLYVSKTYGSSQKNDFWSRFAPLNDFLSDRNYKA